MLKFTWPLALTLLIAPSAFGQGKPPELVFHAVSGTLAPAPLAELGPDFALRTADANPARLPAGALISMRQNARPIPAFLCQNVLILTNGDRVPVRPAGSFKLDQDRLYFQPASPFQPAEPLNLSVNFASVLALGDASGYDDQERFLARLQREARPKDVILLADGDKLEGNLKSLDAEQGATLDVGGQDRQVPLAKMRALAFNTEFRIQPRVKGPFAHVVLDGGGRLGLSQVRFDAGKAMLTGKPLFGGPMIRVPLTSVFVLDVRQGPAVYLSDLPGVYQSTSYLGVSWPLVKDANVSALPMRLGQSTFDKGLGMHSPSKVTYKLDGKYSRFEALAGLDERDGRLGRARLKVLVDGKERSLSGEPKEDASLRTRHDGPLQIRLDMRGAKELTLVVEVADFGDVQAQVNWANARLIRQDAR